MDALGIPWPSGHSWDMVFFTIAAFVQYTHLLIPLTMTAVGGWISVILLAWLGADDRRLWKDVAFCTIFAVPIFVFATFATRARLREQLMNRIDVYRDSYVGLLTHGTRLRDFLSVLPDEERRGTGRTIMYVFALMSWQELAGCLLIAVWALVAFTPDFFLPGSPWPFVDAVSWLLMQADFVVRGSAWWPTFLHLVGAGTMFVFGFSGIHDWMERRAVLKLTSAVRRNELPEQLFLSARKARPDDQERLCAAVIAARSPVTIWERLRIPRPKLLEVLLVLSVGYGILLAIAAFSAHTKQLFVPQPPEALGRFLWMCLLEVVFMSYAVVMSLARDWRFWVVVLPISFLVAAVVSRYYQSQWQEAYKAAFARYVIECDYLYGRKSPVDEAEGMAIMATIAKRGPYPRTAWELMLSAAWYVGLIGLAVMWGCLLVGWWQYPTYLPAHVLPSYGSGAGFARPAEPTSCLFGTARLGCASWNPELHTAARVNLIAARAWRKGGLDGMEVAMEALRAAHLTSGAEEAGDPGLWEVYEHAVSTLVNVQVSGLRHVNWKVGGRWSLHWVPERSSSAAPGAPAPQRAGAAAGSRGRKAAKKSGRRSAGSSGGRSAGSPVYSAGGGIDTDIDIDTGARWDPASLFGACEYASHGPDADLPWGRRDSVVSGRCPAGQDPEPAPDGSGLGTRGRGARSRRDARSQSDAAEDVKRGAGGVISPSEKPASRTPETKPQRSWSLLQTLPELALGIALVVWLVFAGPDWLRSPDKFLDMVTSRVQGLRQAKASSSKRKSEAPAKAKKLPEGDKAGKKTRQQQQQQKERQEQQQKAAKGAVQAKKPSRAEAPTGAAPSSVASDDSCGSAEARKAAAAAPAGKAATQKDTNSTGTPAKSGKEPVKPSTASPAGKKEGGAPASEAPGGQQQQTAASAASGGSSAGGAAASAQTSKSRAGKAAAASTGAARKSPAPVDVRHGGAPAVSASGNAAGATAQPTAAAAAAAIEAALPFTSTLARKSRGRSAVPDADVFTAVPPPPAAAPSPPSPPPPPPPAAAAPVASSWFSFGKSAQAKEGSAAANAWRPATPLPAGPGRAHPEVAAHPSSPLAAPPAAQVPAMPTALGATTAARPAAAPPLPPPVDDIPVPIPIPRAATRPPAPSVVSQQPPVVTAQPQPQPQQRPTPPAPPAAPAAVPPPSPAAAPAPAAASVPPVGLNPALAHFLRRAQPPPPQPPSNPPAAPPAPKPAAPAPPPPAAAKPAPVGGLWGNVPGLDPTICVQCRSAPRVVCFVHDLTCHMCLCATCGANARDGDPCPICHKRSDRVVQFKPRVAA